MYKEHQNNTLLGSYITSDEIVSENDDNKAFPQLIESASEDENGVIYATVANTSATKQAKLRCQIADRRISTVTAEILTGDCHDKNDFDAPDVVTPQPFDGFRKHTDGFTATLPPCSVVKFVIRP